MAANGALKFSAADRILTIQLFQIELCASGNGRELLSLTAYTAVTHISKSQARSVGLIFWGACIPRRLPVAAVPP
jgi:hypothetical protein